MTVLDKLRQDGIPLSADCGGQGVCGKCAVRITQNGETTRRLACVTEYAPGMVVAPAGPVADDRGYRVLGLYESVKPFVCDRAAAGYGLAVDIGTTTIAMAWLALATGERIAQHTRVNSQRGLGADVITRIKLAGEGKLTELGQRVAADISRGLAELAACDGVRLDEGRQVVITGNTTMLHLLLGLPCASLGQFPFTPVTVALSRHRFQDICPASPLDAPVTILPGVSAFVGADIVAGIHFIDMRGQAGENSLFIDLGTNGEMALYAHAPGRLWVTSTAAGPAFEAGNISQGLGSVPGAIARVEIDEALGTRYETIGGGPALGLCGTGVVSLTAALIRRGIVDETGRLADAYFDAGFPVAAGIRFTQKDVREVQLAKSAVRAGLEIMIEQAGLTYGDISAVYMAGGFGHTIDLDSAVTLGIIPAALAPKVKTVGNAALGGAVAALLSETAEADMTTLAARATELNLSAHPRFNTYFMEYMML